MSLGEKISKITSSDSFLDDKGLISGDSMKLLSKAGTLEPFFKNINQKKILQSLYSAGYFCENDEKAIDLALLTGIEGGLVIQTLLNFGGDRFKDIAEKVSNGEMIGGFAVTEEGKSGSLAHKMSTEYCYNEEKKTYHLKTNKENPKWFQGASMGDFLIVIARKNRNYALFYVPQKEINSTPIETVGLTGIRYARNNIDCVLPEENLLKEIGPREFPELFIRSRLQLIGINRGIIEKSLNIYRKITETIKDKVAMESLEVSIKCAVVEILYKSVEEKLDPQKSVSKLSSLGAVVKAIGSKMMQEVVEELRRKFGAAGFEKGHLAEQMSNSGLPFTIFEGSNEMLFSSLIQKLSKRPEEIKNLVSKEHYLEIEKLVNDKDGNTQILGEIISWIFVKDQALKSNITSVENAEESVINFIDMKIAQLKLKLDFHKRNIAQAF